MERIEDGCYTPEGILRCESCQQIVIDMSLEEVKLCIAELVAQGRVEERPQGGKTDMARGMPTHLYVPAGTPGGNEYTSNRPRGDEMTSGKGE